MKTFEIEVIHEGTGTYMDFEIVTANEELNEDNIWRYILDDLSIIANLVDNDEEDDEDELDN